MTGSDRERDVDALAEALASAGIADAAGIWAEHAEGCLGDCAARGCPVQRQEWIGVEGVARAVLASDWLAAHDKAIAARALRSLRDHCDVRAGAPVAPGCPAAGDRQFWIRMAAAIDDYLNGSENA